MPRLQGLVLYSSQSVSKNCERDAENQLCDFLLCETIPRLRLLSVYFRPVTMLCLVPRLVFAAMVIGITTGTPLSCGMIVSEIHFALSVSQKSQI